MSFELNTDWRTQGVKVDGKEIPNVCKYDLEVEAGCIPVLTIKCMLVKPLEINGDGVIKYDGEFINEEMARQIYEQLKERFEK